MAAPAPWKLLTALWTVYLVWGSTYLAIKVSVETLPAFLSAGARFLPLSTLENHYLNPHIRDLMIELLKNTKLHLKKLQEG